MKVTIEPVVVDPPKRVTIVMDEDEAAALYAIVAKCAPGEGPDFLWMLYGQLAPLGGKYTVDGDYLIVRRA